MALSNEDLERLERKVPEVATLAVQEAYWRALERLGPGESIMIAIDTILYRIHKDGTKTPVKTLPPRKSIPTGTRIRIR